MSNTVSARERVNQNV